MGQLDKGCKIRMVKMIKAIEEGIKLKNDKKTQMEKGRQVTVRQYGMQELPYEVGAVGLIHV